VKGEVGGTKGKQGKKDFKSAKLKVRSFWVGRVDAEKL